MQITSDLIIKESTVHDNEKMLSNLITMIERIEAELESEIELMESSKRRREFKKRVRLLRLLNEDLDKAIERYFVRLEKVFPENQFTRDDLPHPALEKL